MTNSLASFNPASAGKDLKPSNTTTDPNLLADTYVMEARVFSLFIQGMSLQDVSKATGLQEHKVKPLLNKAKRRWKKLNNDRFREQTEKAVYAMIHGHTEISSELMRQFYEAKDKADEKDLGRVIRLLCQENSTFTNILSKLMGVATLRLSGDLNTSPDSSIDTDFEILPSEDLKSPEALEEELRASFDRLGDYVANGKKLIGDKIDIVDEGVVTKTAPEPDIQELERH